MKNVLDPLTRLPGVRLAALISSDGVPIDIRSNDKPRSTSKNGENSSHGGPELGAEDLNALSALSSCWIAEITRAVTPLTWGIPQRLVLRAARGTLIVVQAPRALLLVVLEGGMRPEELRLPMGVAIARMERHLRAIEPKSNDKKQPASSDSTGASGPPGIFPATNKTAQPGADPVHATGNEVPEGSGE